MARGPVLRSLLTSLLLILSFPRPDQGWLALVALVPLMSACGRTHFRRAFILGWTAGSVWLFVSLGWLNVTMTRYGGIPPALGYLLILMVALVHGILVGAFAACVPATGSMARSLQAVVLASTWVACEFVRSWLPAPFPWLLLGSAFWRHGAASPLYAAAGVYGVTWACVAVNVLILRCGTDLAAGRRRAALSGLGVLAAAAAILALLPSVFPGPTATQPLRVAVVQGNFEQEEKWDERIKEQTLEVYLSLSREAVRKGAELVVWPETSVPFFFQSERDLADRISRFVEDSGVHLVFGSPAYEVRDGGIVLFNRAYHLGPERVLEHYDKVRLVPFGEYVPFKWALPFVRKMVPSIGEFVPGQWERPFRTPVPSGPLICYEVSMPGLTRREVKGGSRILINMTNDSWFGESWGPYQHLALAGVRAAENGTPVLRAANTGVSGVFDRRGRLVESIGLQKRGIIVADVEPRKSWTMYGRTGDMAVYFSALVITIFIWTEWRRSRKSGGAPWTR